MANEKGGWDECGEGGGLYGVHSCVPFVSNATHKCAVRTAVII